MWKRIRNMFRRDLHRPRLGGLEILKYIGPGLLVTVGFIDPGNWASNIAAGANYGYTLLWMVTLSTGMLILLQHNAAHLGIATGLCLSEAATLHLRPIVSRGILATAVAASVSTALAEILGGAIALNMLFRTPIRVGAVLTCLVVGFLLFSNTYRRLERIIIGFVSLIGLSFIYELTLVPIDWGRAAVGWVRPEIPEGSMLIVMSVLGAVVMPHNLFLHSEIIQSRQWNREDEAVIRRQLDYEYYDTLFSMIVGWAINSAMILLAAAAFFNQRLPVEELRQAKSMLEPLLGGASGVVFAVALLLAGIASSITAGMAGGSIVAGISAEPYDIRDNHTRLGIGITLLAALGIIFFIGSPFRGLIISQAILSLQLPFTIFLLIRLTSSRAVMGTHANSWKTTLGLSVIGLVVTYLNVRLLVSLLA
ncbi:MAG: Nramp family divalent metal transporter [Syntrophales bacterium]